jgi:hypothetical protein
MLKNKTWTVEVEVDARTMSFLARWGNGLHWNERKPVFEVDAYYFIHAES